MSNKRPLSPESTNSQINDINIRSLKRLKLHSIIQELRNEEANLVILKKLRSCQQLATRTNNNILPTTTTTTTTTTNGFHPTATRILTTKPTTPNTSLSNSSSRTSLQQSLTSATRKPSNSINPPLPTKIPTPLPTKTSSSTIYSLEERKTQAKKALRTQLERDLLNIPSPKPLLRDILFIPNPTSLEFQPYIGLEDVVQCLYELQTDRQRLPQRFTDRAHIDEPYICDHCGTDFTIRWWKHINTNQQINILCDRCKKQVIRRTSKSEHSTLLKNVFVSAMEQEKEIEKTFQTLIKQQQKNASRSSSSSSVSTTKPVTNNTNNNRPIPSIPSYHHHHHHHHQQQQQQKTKTKISLPQTQNFATKISQQSTSLINATRKSNVIVQSQINSTNNIRSLQHNKIPMPAHQHQQFRSATALPQQTKTNQLVKTPKSAIRQQQQNQQVVSSRPMYHQPTSGIISSSNIHPSISSSTNIRPTATKRRTLPTDNLNGTKKALVFVANGSEDIEVVATVDVLRRGGIDVKLCSVEKNDKKPITCANNIQLVPNLHIDDVKGQKFDAIIVPGGSKGTEQIASCKKAGTLLVDHYKTNKLVAAICAGPIALSTHLYDADENTRKHDITCYPEAVNTLKNKFKSIKLDTPVVYSEINNHHLITSQGPATAIEFALKILSHLIDEKKAEEIRKKVLA
ncbi:unnamed protein product [Rotaria sordida]|uniref:DJ-1/PfpI domain-containing protein n=1 Tax=Rotaria sordida TaxID=392033 RepID=A0A814UG10_9BILA|nr:unnamed protein product [Rotaria sordida]